MNLRWVRQNPEICFIPTCIHYLFWLVVWNMFHFSISIGNVIIPIDELVLSQEVVGVENPMKPSFSHVFFPMVFLWFCHLQAFISPDCGLRWGKPSKLQPNATKARWNRKWVPVGWDVDFVWWFFDWYLLDIPCMMFTYDWFTHSTSWFYIVMLV